MDTFDAVADPVRRDLVLAAAVTPTSAGDLAARHPGISRPAVSRHLRVLLETGVLVADADGRRRVYRLAPHGLAAVRAFLDAATAAPASRVTGALDALETEVARTRRERQRTDALTSGTTAGPAPARPSQRHDRHDPDDPDDQERTA